MRLYKRKGTGFWYAEFERHRPKSLKCKDKATAQEIFRKLKKEYLKGRWPVLTGEKSPPLQEFIKGYLEVRDISKARDTYMKDALSLKRLLQVVGNRKLSLISREDIDRFVADSNSRGMKRVSINTYLRHLKSAFSTAVKMEYVKRSPLEKYPLLREEPRPSRFVPPKSLHVIADLMEKDGEHELVTMFWFYVLTGARRREIFNLQAEDIHREAGYIRMRGKGGQEKWAAISPLLDEKLEIMDLPKSGRIFQRYQHPDTITHKMKKYLMKAGFRDFRLHDLRHTAASLLALSGATQWDIKDFLGHRDLRTSDRYVHLGDERLKKVVVNLDSAVKGRSVGEEPQE